MRVLSLVAVAAIASAAFAAPVKNETDSQDPCCQGACKTPGQAKYWSIAKGILGTKHCGECCMDPKDYKLYHLFEKNLTKSDVDSPCEVR